MKTLTLVRHAKSSWEHPELDDRDRPLNKRGERDAPIMGQRIAAAGIRPSLIIASPATRAWSTAKIIANEIGYPREFLQREIKLYHASLDTMLDVLVAQDADVSGHHGADLASAEDLQRFYQHLEDVLREIEFTDSRSSTLMRQLRRLYNRTHLTQEEVNILRGILSSVQWKTGNSG